MDANPQQAAQRPRELRDGVFLWERTAHGDICFFSSKAHAETLANNVATAIASTGLEAQGVATNSPCEFTAWIFIGKPGTERTYAMVLHDESGNAVGLRVNAAGGSHEFMALDGRTLLAA